MKYIISPLVVLLMLTACNSDKTTKSETDTKSTPVSPGIDNVDGNIPDTSRAIRLNNPLPKDSSRINDSVPH